MRAKRLVTTIAIVGAGALALSACSSGGTTAAAGGPGSATFSYLSQDTNTTISSILTTLSTSECSAANKAAPYSFETTPGAAMDQKLQLLAGQDALPSAFMAPGTPALVQQFIKGGQLQELGATLKTAGLDGDILPAARSTLQALYSTDGLYALPTEFNIEGIWYNKKLFADNNITVPATWDELLSATETLKSAGVIPISADGKDGWNVSRYIGDYIFRDLGPDALQKVADGTAKLTDPEYVKAADAVAALGKSGAFGDSVGSIDYDNSLNQFLSGKAAMLYMGSWALANFNDPKQNTIGVDNVGFMPFPAVAGGKGSIDQIPSNVGVPLTFATKGFGTNIEAWLNCIAPNYGNQVLKDKGVISGFKTTETPADLPALTKGVQDTIANSPSSVLWFEALFSAKGTSVAQTNAAQLATGGMSGADYMKIVQAANETK
ncbi:extracellular solute-binding protein [Cryobacterium glucosi]|uniref:Extracellular solute-binding protein n=2 Tax=Cryobacterium glucosi TaxID=1259175 RepID=A0ABY2IQD7_9MICO|nr:extracellular solute-binding protein [Cryobacterium glucosi]